MWTTVREKVRERSRTTEVMLAGAIVRAVEGDTLVLSHESAPLAKRLTSSATPTSSAKRSRTRSAWTGRSAAKSAPRSRRFRRPRRAPTAVAPTPPQRDDDEESMLAEAGNDTADAPRRDPEEVALELLQNELGARRIDGG